jgi:hypothetical protein
MLGPAVAQPRRSILNGAICELHLLLTAAVQLVQGRVVQLATRYSQEGFYDLKKSTYNSVTVANRPHIDIFFYLKDLGNQFLQ